MAKQATVREKQWIKISSLGFNYKVCRSGLVMSSTRYVRCKSRGVEYKREIKGVVMMPFDNGNGYKCITTSIYGKRKNKYVHRLVAEQFCVKPAGSTEVNHIDGDKSNNSSENLEWVTSAENSNHASKSGLLRAGTDHYKFISAVQAERSGVGFVMFGKRQINSSGFSSSCVYNCLNNKAKSHKNYIFSRIM